MDNLGFEYQIPGSDYCTAIKTDKELFIIDCDGDTFAKLPYEWNQKEIDIWYKGYENGYNQGKKNGISRGTYDVQNSICKALGIYGIANDVEQLSKRVYRLEDE